jgi:nucleoside-diphosphate-sugar epimerase
VSIAVVGAEGALGGLLCKRLGARAVALRHRSDVLDMRVPELEDADVVVNVAGPRVRPNLGWSDYLREHVGTAEAVARSMKKGSHLVHFSSAAVWGTREGVIGPRTAEAPSRFSNPSYAWAKLAGEHAARAIAHERGVAITVLRPTMVYGPGVSSAMETLQKVAEKGVAIELLPRAGRQHCLHESLLVRTIEALAARGSRTNDPLPVCDPFVFTNQEMCDAVARRAGARVRAPVHVGLARDAVRSWPGFPERDAPGALASFAFLGLDVAFDPKPLFEATGLDPHDFRREITLDVHLGGNP